MVVKAVKDVVIPSGSINDLLLYQWRCERVPGYRDYERYLKVFVDYYDENGELIGGDSGTFDGLNRVGVVLYEGQVTQIRFDCYLTEMKSFRAWLQK